MVNEEQMINDFVAAITAEVDERRRRIERDSDQYVSDRLKKAENEILEDVYTVVRRRSAENKGKAGREVSQMRTGCRKKLLERRARLAEGVFADAERKIAAFTESADYEPFVINSVKSAAAALGEGERTVFVRQQDMHLADAIKSAADCSVEMSDDIVLGGIMMKCGRLIADDTLDARLERERSAFRENYKIEI